MYNANDKKNYTYDILCTIASGFGLICAVWLRYAVDINIVYKDVLLSIAMGFSISTFYYVTGVDHLLIDRDTN